MNEIPQSGPEREKYIISVMQGVKREGDRVVNIQCASRGEGRWMDASAPVWDWSDTDYRLYEPEVVHYANGYENFVSPIYWHKTLDQCSDTVLLDANRTHYVKMTTGGGRTIPEYESLPLERGE